MFSFPGEGAAAKEVRQRLAREIITLQCNKTLFLPHAQEKVNAAKRQFFQGMSRLFFSGPPARDQKK
jgi:hypothetical protein